MAASPPILLDAVLPLTRGDAPRARILVESLRVFFPDLRTLFVVTPDSHAEEVASVLAWSKVEVLKEGAVLPEIAFYRALYRASIAFRRRPAPWFIQQLVKLAAPAFVATDFYLTLDADVICARPTRGSDLVVGGRALAQRRRGHFHDDWYAWAKRVLAQEPSGWTHGVTPCLLHTAGVRSLQRHLARRTSPWLVAAEAAGGRLGLQWPMSSWAGYLLRHMPWTEYALYFTHLEATGAFDAQFTDHLPRPLYDGAVWERADFANWRPELVFDNPDGPFFCLVQSWLGIPPAEVWARVGPFLTRAGAQDLSW